MTQAANLSDMQTVELGKVGASIKDTVPYMNYLHQQGIAMEDTFEERGQPVQYRFEPAGIEGDNRFALLWAVQRVIDLEQFGSGGELPPPRTCGVLRMDLADWIVCWRLRMGDLPFLSIGAGMFTTGRLQTLVRYVLAGTFADHLGLVADHLDGLSGENFHLYEPIKPGDVRLEVTRGAKLPPDRRLFVNPDGRLHSESLPRLVTGETT